MTNDFYDGFWEANDVEYIQNQQALIELWEYEAANEGHKEGKHDNVTPTIPLLSM